MFEIRLARGALEDLRRLRAHDRARIIDEIERCLVEQPQQPSRNRKELTALVPPWEHVPPVWELRVDDYRVFYDVDARARRVIVRAVRPKGRSTTKEIV
jgi:mRNA-degrading endonuclease RelE of RelBE toxin-antitoxin system